MTARSFLVMLNPRARGTAPTLHTLAVFNHTIMARKPLTRREFLKLTALGLGSLAFRHWNSLALLPDFPDAERLGRAAKGSLEIKAQPDMNSETVGILYEDNVAPWIREVVSDYQDLNFINQRWVEVPGGYVYGARFQPVRNIPNEPVTELPNSFIGPGMWAEVTVPYVDAFTENDPSPNSWVDFRVRDGLPPRLYYSQIFWVDRIRTNDAGQVFYRVNPNYYGGLDLLWAPGEAFRPITKEEIAPIRPEVENKRIVVDINHQTLSCYEGDTEVYFCRISSGAKYNVAGEVVDAWSTPAGEFWISRKYLGVQMSGNATGAPYDSPGIGWSMFFATGGVALHSTYWHNAYGTPMSHGCVNASPEDAKWIFRWTAPEVPYDPGMLDATVTGLPSTKVEVVEV